MQKWSPEERKGSIEAEKWSLWVAKWSLSVGNGKWSLSGIWVPEVAKLPLEVDTWPPSGQMISPPKNGLSVQNWSPEEGKGSLEAGKWSLLEEK